MQSERKNKLFFGDNLYILREQMATESVDLIYLDTPFNSDANYNVLFQKKTSDIAERKRFSQRRVNGGGLPLEP